jgi:hypothetical protein
MLINIQVDLGPLLDPFTEIQRAKILVMVFGALHDGYGDLREELDNSGDLHVEYEETFADQTALAVSTTRDIEELIEQAFKFMSERYA